MTRRYAYRMSTGDPGPADSGQYPPPAAAGANPAGFGADPTQPYSTAPYPTTPVGPVATTAEERNWGMAAHLSAIVGAWLFLGFTGPLVVLLIKGDRSRYVRAHTIEALNFNLSVLLYAIVGGILTLVLVGFVILAAVGILWLVCTVLATVKASNGELYRYPLTIRLVH